MSVNDTTKWRRNGPGIVNCLKCHARVSTNAFALAKHRCKDRSYNGIKDLESRLDDFFGLDKKNTNKFAK